ncbi:MAG TPA: gamma-glutamylcyclotransferase family protein [Armatimonadota bacterium]|nr:gamma-glutamylcyclotransferase family protein [Armatimonadota bacterium]
MDTASRLFVFGTLANREYFRIITGKTFARQEAVLPGYQYRSVPPRFACILPAADASVTGVLLDGVDAETLAHLDRYEDSGKRCERQCVTVQAGGESVTAFTYVGKPEAAAASCGIAPETAEEPLEQEIAAVLAGLASPQPSKPAPLEEHVRRELAGDVIEELRRQGSRSHPLALMRIRQNLERIPLPGLTWLEKEPAAQQYAGNYLRLIARLVAFNQIEERIFVAYREVVRQPSHCYSRSASILAALTFLNRHAEALDAGLRQEGMDRYTPGREYSDTAQAALRVAEALYDPDAIQRIVQRIFAARQEGGTPLGAEMEFSPLGARAVTAPPGADPAFDSFFYFHDFDLARRLRKLGGYVDDHTGVCFDESRSRGFLELALGRLQVGGDYSRPVTNDPALLAALIRETVLFTGIRPHSLHISMQAIPERPFTQATDPTPFYCLLLLGGDLSRDRAGVLREKRLALAETKNLHQALTFSRLNAHRPGEEASADATVVEFTFPRLAPRRPYELLILALKGFQWATNPMPLALTTERGPQREMAKALMSWARSPQPLQEEEIQSFAALVAQGLRTEQALTGGHSDAYIAEKVEQIKRHLIRRNQCIKEQAQ